MQFLGCNNLLRIILNSNNNFDLIVSHHHYKSFYIILIHVMHALSTMVTKPSGCIVINCAAMQTKHWNTYSIYFYNVYFLLVGVMNIVWMDEACSTFLRMISSKSMGYFKAVSRALK